MPPTSTDIAHVAIIGGGPAGIGPLVHAARTGRLDELLALGVAIFDNQPAACYGSGNLGHYVIPSNTSATAFVNQFLRSAEGESARLFESIEHSSVVKEVKRYKNASCPLSLAGRVLSLAAQLLLLQIQQSPRSCSHFDTAVESIMIDEHGIAHIRGVETSSSRVFSVRARNVLMATGGQQRVHNVDACLRSRAVTGIECLTERGVDQLRRQLLRAKPRRYITARLPLTNLPV